MKRFSLQSALSFFTAFMAVNTGAALNAASISYGGGSTVQINALPSVNDRVAVDVSSNLLQWKEITNAVAASGSLVVADPDAEGQLSRFYRLSDADDTVDVKGYVVGPERFGPVANASVEIAGGWSTRTDGNGFFHFDHRFLRSDLPLIITAHGPTVDGVTRQIFGSDAGAIVPLQLTLAELSQFTVVVGGKYHFQTQSGPRAGSQFTLTLQLDRFQIDGDITAAGSYTASLTAPGLLNLSFDGGGSSTVYFWGYHGTNVDFNKMLFAGIPSPRGTLAGNGVVTLEIPGIQGPPLLGSVKLNYNSGISGVSNYTVTLSGGASGYFTVTNGIAPHPQQQGSYIYQNAFIGASEVLHLNYGTNESDDLTLTFKDGATGTFVGTQTTPLNSQIVAGGTFEYVTNAVIVAPNQLSGHAYAFAGLTINFFDQTYSVKTGPTAGFGGNYAASTSFNTFTVTFIDNGFLAGSAQLTFLTTNSGMITYQHGTSPVEGSQPVTTAFFETSVVGPAPATLSKVRFQMGQSLLGPYSATVNLSGGASGSFVITDGSTGSGSYTYSVTGNIGHLFLNYQGEFAGDFDSFNLQFVTGPGAWTDNTLTGIQRVTGTDGPCSGNFSYE